jgi:hypothetical protein
MAAPKFAPAADDSYKLAEDFGVGPGAVPAGQVVVVTGVYPPGTPGLGVSVEDMVTADFVDIDHSPRTLALPVSEFTARFKKVA